MINRAGWMAMLVVVMVSVAMMASEYASASAIKEASKAAQDGHGKSEAKPAAKSGHGGGGAEAEATPTPEPTPDPNIITNEWVPGKITKMPAVSGKAVVGGGSVTKKAEVGYAMVVVFVASWCEPCQSAVQELERIQGKYEKIHTRVLYVFSHDAAQDAQDFASEYKIAERSLVADAATIATFKNPPLPTVYLVDRREWIAGRWVEIKPEGIQELDNALRLMTAW